MRAAHISLVDKKGQEIHLSSFLHTYPSFH